jgi:hypothetical protein
MMSCMRVRVLFCFAVFVVHAVLITGAMLLLI